MIVRMHQYCRASANLAVVFFFLHTKVMIFLFYCISIVEKRKENITDLPRQGGQKKKLGKHTTVK